MAATGAVVLNLLVAAKNRGELLAAAQSIQYVATIAQRERLSWVFKGRYDELKATR